MELIDKKSKVMKKDEIFEPYHKLGFIHFINTNILGLKSPKAATQRFYFVLMFLILSIAFLV